MVFEQLVDNVGGFVKRIGQSIDAQLTKIDPQVLEVAILSLDLALFMLLCYMLHNQVKRQRAFIKGLLTGIAASNGTRPLSIPKECE